MDRNKRRTLEEAGWRVGTASEFLDLTEAEAALIDMKLALSDGLRNLRVEKSLTQSQVARIIGSSQSRIAKMEAGDPSVSMDLLVRTLLRLGASRANVANLMGLDPSQKAVGSA